MMYEEEVMANKRLRQEIDVKIQEVKELPCSRERSLYNKVARSRYVAWNGFEKIRDPNPYPSSKDPSTGTKIEPTADGLKL